MCVCAVVAAGSVYAVKDGHTIGRNTTADICVKDKLISRAHGVMEITRRRHVVVFTDSSHNGTFFQSSGGSEPYRTLHHSSIVLNPGDCLLMGRSVLRLETRAKDAGGSDDVGALRHTGDDAAVLHGDRDRDRDRDSDVDRHHVTPRAAPRTTPHGAPHVDVDDGEGDKWWHAPQTEVGVSHVPSPSNVSDVESKHAHDHHSHSHSHSHYRHHEDVPLVEDELEEHHHTYDDDDHDDDDMWATGAAQTVDDDRRHDGGHGDDDFDDNDDDNFVGNLSRRTSLQPPVLQTGTASKLPGRGSPAERRQALGVKPPEAAAARRMSSPLDANPGSAPVLRPASHDQQVRDLLNTTLDLRTDEDDSEEEEQRHEQKVVAEERSSTEKGTSPGLELLSVTDDKEDDDDDDDDDAADDDDDDDEWY